eukprot:8811807-Lingulodinium_polyedra.AAC.1
MAGPALHAVSCARKVLNQALLLADTAADDVEHQPLAQSPDRAGELQVKLAVAHVDHPLGLREVARP